MGISGLELEDLGASIPARLEPNHPDLIRKAMVHLLGAAIAADGEVTARAWAPTLVGMVAGDVDIRVGPAREQARAGETESTGGLGTPAMIRNQAEAEARSREPGS